MTEPTPSLDPTDHDLSALRAAEQARRKRGLLIFAGCIVAVCALFAAIYIGTEGRQGPSMPIEETEAEDAKLTNDPVCRALIADITELGKTWRALDKRLDAEVFGADADKTAQGEAELGALRAALAEQQAKSLKANLRFEPSRAELDAWFAHIDKELQLLSWLAASHGDAAPSAPPFKIRDPERAPAQIRTGVVASIHDDFEGFRVWHTSGMHPCGPAAP